MDDLSPKSRLLGAFSAYQPLIFHIGRLADFSDLTTFHEDRI